MEDTIRDVGISNVWENDSTVWYTQRIAHYIEKLFIFQCIFIIIVRALANAIGRFDKIVVFYVSKQFPQKTPTALLQQ